MGFKTTPIEQRLNSLVDMRGADECWPWRGALEHNGYGRIAISSKPFRKAPAHRVAYELRNGPIPSGLEAHHICSNRACCNPSHIKPITHRENTLLGDTITARAAGTTHCPQGHPYDSENTLLYSAKGGRLCRVCQRQHQRNHKARLRLRSKQ